MKYIKRLVQSLYPTFTKNLIIITTDQLKQCAKRYMGYPNAFSVQTETCSYVAKRGTCFVNNMF
jgi:hypothetical protein